MTGSKPTTNRIRYDAIQSDSWEGSMDEMKRILGATNPKAVDQAGTAYIAVSKKFNETADLLRKHAITIAQAWKGKDAEAAQKQMQRLNATCREVGYRSSQSGYALKDHGEKLQWYKDHAPDEGMFSGIDVGDVKAFAFGGLIGVGAKRAFIGSEEDKAAREHMNRLIGRTVEANSYMPQDITTDLPNPGKEVYGNPPGSPPGGRVPTGGGGVPTGGGPGGANLPKDPFGNGGPSAGLDPFGTGEGGPTGPGGIGTPNSPTDPFGPGSGRPPGTDLAGTPPLGGGGVPGGGLGGDPFGRGGLGAGAGAGGGLGGGVGGLGGGAGGLGGAPMGAGGMAGAGPGAGRGLGGRTGTGAGMGTGAGAGSGRGNGMMGGGAPMGGGGGKNEEEYERSTWLVEDEDVWGANDGDAAPPVIG